MYDTIGCRVDLKEHTAYSVFYQEREIFRYANCLSALLHVIS